MAATKTDQPSTAETITSDTATPAQQAGHRSYLQAQINCYTRYVTVSAIVRTPDGVVAFSGAGQAVNADNTHLAQWLAEGVVADRAWFAEHPDRYAAWVAANGVPQDVIDAHRAQIDAL